uniref:Uncharacterized protein n=1 Tax=Salix viminalis TaxID=40686 RepID=A0A6N2K106_SALVM
MPCQHFKGLHHFVGSSTSCANNFTGVIVNDRKLKERKKDINLWSLHLCSDLSLIVCELPSRLASFAEAIVKPFLLSGQFL